MANSFQSYALALLTLVRSQEVINNNPPLGVAIRRDGTDISSLNIPAHNLLRFLIEHSPSPETIARLFIAELVRCEIPAVKFFVNTLNSSGRSVSPGDWAMAVQAEIRQTGGTMKPLTDPASFSLTSLVIGFRKRSVKKVPLDRTPNRTLQDSLLELEAVHRRQVALQELVCINLLLTISLERCLDHSPGWPLLPYYGCHICWGWERDAPLHAHHPILYPQ